MGQLLISNALKELSETLWYRFQMVAYSNGIHQNLLVQQTKVQKKIWAKWTKRCKKTEICMR